MILFIFEGRKQEPRIYKTIKRLFFDDGNEEEILHYYCNNIYSLYKTLKEYDVLNDAADIVNVLREQSSKHPCVNSEFYKIKHSDEVSQIYLFFDYDLNGKDKAFSIDEQNAQIAAMLEYFDDESKGRLYVSYPMVESFRYFKKPLPDENYKDYAVDARIDGKFKELVQNDSYYKNLKELCFNLDKSGRLKPMHDKSREKKIRTNWLFIKELNIKKANFICCDDYSIPKDKSLVAQQKIFCSQIEKYIKPKKEISILNAFPLFLFEYFKEPKESNIGIQI